MKAIIIVIIILLSQTQSIHMHTRGDAEKIIKAISCINEKIKVLNEHNHLKKVDHQEEKLKNFALKMLSQEWNKFADEINKRETIEDYAKDKSKKHEEFEKLRKNIEALHNISQDKDT